MTMLVILGGAGTRFTLSVRGRTTIVHRYVPRLFASSSGGPTVVRTGRAA